MRAIIDTAVDAITVIDRDATILEVSPASESMLGTPNENRRGRSVLQFVHYNDQAVVLASIRKIFDEGQASTARFRCYTMTATGSRSSRGPSARQ